MFDRTFPLVLIFLLGYFLKRKNVLKSRDSAVLSALLINVVVPVVIIDSLSSTNMELNLVYLPLSALVVVSSLMVSGYFFSLFLKLRKTTKKSFVISFPTLEGGTIGYAFMLAAFGNMGLSRIVFFDLGNSLFLFTFVYVISCYLGKGGLSFGESIMKIIRSPLIWAIPVGLALNIVGFQSAFLSGLFDIIGGSMLLLVMLMVGLKFRPSPSSLRVPLYTIVLKTPLGFLLGRLVSVVFGLEGVERIAVMVGSSLPPSVMTLVFSEENDLDVEYTANLLAIALPVSIVYLTILVGLLG